MENISFLLGSGFSIPAGIPSVKTLNKRMCKINAEEILIHGDQTAIFLNGQNDPNKWSRKDEKLFLQDFLEYYSTIVLKTPEEFHYETFFDYYSDYLRNKSNKEEIEKFYNKFNNQYYKDKEINRDCHNRIADFNRTYNQLLSSQLHKLEYLQDLGITGYPNYGGFFDYLKELLKNNENLKIHSLNHDLLFDWVGKHDSDLWQEYSDGYEIEGSPYYGTMTHNFGDDSHGMHKSYKVKLERFTDKFDTRLCLYKLHGSIFNTIAYNHKSNRIRIKLNYGVNEYFEEILDEKTKKHQFKRLWENVEPDFLSGTTTKIIKYAKDEYYITLFEHFKNNLISCKFLIVIGYGFQDPGINEYLIEHCLKQNKKVIVIDPIKPSSKLFTEFDIIHIPKSISEITFNDLHNL